MSENLQRLQRALAEKGFVMRPPPPADPMSRVQIPGVGGGFGGRGPMVSTPGMNVAQPARPTVLSTRSQMDPDGDADASPASPHDEEWELSDSFTPHGLVAAAGEGARFWGGVLEPIGDAALGLGRAAIGGVRQFGENLAARDAADRRLSDAYMPQIRAANANTERLMAADARLSRMEIANVDEAESRMDGLRSQLEERRRGGVPAFTPLSTRHPDDMTDEELLAEIQRGRAMQ